MRRSTPFDPEQAAQITTPILAPELVAEQVFAFLQP
jgi:hypothetical protein